MNDTWAFGLLFSASHPLFGLGIAWVWALSLLLGPGSLLSCVHGLAGALAMPLHCSYYDITSPFTCCYLWAYGLKHLSCQFLILFILLDFTAQHSCWAKPFHALGFLSPFHSLGILGLFHFLGILSPHLQPISFFGHPRPISLFLISFTPSF